MPATPNPSARRPGKRLHKSNALAANAPDTDDTTVKQLIINADDLGIGESANRAIRDAYVDGVLTSASLMALGPAFEHAVETVVKPLPKLGVGLHLCLTSGRCVAAPEKVKRLTDDGGLLCRGFGALMRLSKTADGSHEIERELDAQFQRILEAGVSIDHVNSHRHVHMIPAIFAVVVRLARRYDCPAIRISDERIGGRAGLVRPRNLTVTFVNAPKKLVLGHFSRRARKLADGLRTCDRTFGILGSGNMDLAALSDVVATVADGASEIITHPGEENNTLSSELSPGDRAFWNAPARFSEFQALLDARLRQQIERHGVQLARYADIGHWNENEFPRDQLPHYDGHPQRVNRQSSSSSCNTREQT